MDHNSQGWQLARFDPERYTIQLETVVRGTEIPTQGYTIGVLYAGPDGPLPENHLAAAAPDLLRALHAAHEWANETGAPFALLDQIQSTIAKAEYKA